MFCHTHSQGCPFSVDTECWLHRAHLSARDCTGTSSAGPRQHSYLMDVAIGLQISHRYSNSVALINAAFNFTLDGSGKTVKEACVVFGLPGALSHRLCNARLSCIGSACKAVSMSQSYSVGACPKAACTRAGARAKGALLFHAIA